MFLELITSYLLSYQVTVLGGYKSQKTLKILLDKLKDITHFKIICVNYHNKQQLNITDSIK